MLWRLPLGRVSKFGSGTKKMKRFQVLLWGDFNYMIKSSRFWIFFKSVAPARSEVRIGNGGTFFKWWVATELMGFLTLSCRGAHLVCVLSLAVRSKTWHCLFGRKVLMDKKSGQIFLRSIFNPAHHFVRLCLTFLLSEWLLSENIVVENLVGRFLSIPCQNSSLVPRGMIITPEYHHK